jgi:hypothetical protein
VIFSGPFYRGSLLQPATSGTKVMPISASAFEMTSRDIANHISVRV